MQIGLAVSSHRRDKTHRLNRRQVWVPKLDSAISAQTGKLQDVSAVLDIPHLGLQHKPAILSSTFGTKIDGNANCSSEISGL